MAAGAPAPAAVLLLATLLLLAAACGDHGPPGSVQANCNRYALDHAAADSPDGLIPGVVSVGFIKGTTGPEAAAFLKETGTSYWLPTPWREFAVVCTRKGHEEAWADRLKEHDIVEWAHREGTRPLAGSD